jgi:hypothetical protein
MFNVATEDEADLLKFILGSGFRDQELRYVDPRSGGHPSHSVLSVGKQEVGTWTISRQFGQ